jgi:hypothetical protein
MSKNPLNGARISLVTPPQRVPISSRVQFHLLRRELMVFYLFSQNSSFPLGSCIVLLERVILSHYSSSHLCENLGALKMIVLYPFSIYFDQDFSLYPHVRILIFFCNLFVEYIQIPKLFQPWKWRQHVSAKRQYLPIWLHDARTQLDKV